MKKIISVLAVVLVLAASMVLGACQPKIADNTEYYDKITKTLKLTKSYEGKSFLTDGIGPATLDAHTDGDTSRFRLAEGGTINLRYYQIDTPESTTGVEKWGKAASLFVKDKLTTATEIVLEATTVPASTETYGRYLGYVWYKGPGDSDFKNLNLEVVENGFSENKGINTGDYPYYSYFQEANEFAQSIKLRLYSDLDDPLFSTDPIPMTIKEFWNNTDAFYNEEMDAGSRIEMNAYLKSVKVSSTGTYTFTAAQYDEETGEEYTINLYAGYASSVASTMEIGHMYVFVGTVQFYGGAFQISGITYSPLFTTPGNSYVIQSDYYLTFDDGISYISQYRSTLYGDVTVTEVQPLEGNQLTFTGTAFKKSKNGLADEATTFTFTVTVPENYDGEIAVGDKLSLGGLQLEKDSGKITIISYSDIK